MRLALLLSFALVVSACAQTAPQEPLAASDDFDPAPFDRRTTSAQTALRNLDATIDGRERALALRPGDPALTASLSDALLTRSQFRGTFADLDRVVSLGEAAVAVAPDAAWALDVRANAYQAVHRFDDAAADLASAAALDGRDRSHEMTTIWLARGERLDDVLALRSERAAQYPTYRNLTAVAAALGALGRYDAADQAWVRSLAAYRDVSPLPVAYVAFQRGVMWSEQADRPERGLVLYREAVSRFPAYSVANVHLAELEWAAGDAASATARLESVRTLTTDPEPDGLLAEILADQDPGRARTLTEAAAARYDDLLAAHPLAFLDHGAEFYIGPGAQPGRALRMARRNLKNRSNSRAFEIAIDAARAAGDDAALCEFVAGAKATSASVNLERALEQSACSR
jgi:tetratricopeptide (TPR) repeat protein